MILKSMTAYVLDQSKINPLDLIDFKNNVINYAKFLSMPLELKYFVPCDEDGNVLEEPNKSQFTVNRITSGVYYSLLEMYNKAKSEVIFFDTNLVKLDDNVNYRIFHKDLCIYTSTSSLNKIIEDLAKYNLTVTEQAKQKYKF